MSTLPSWHVSHRQDIGRVLSATRNIKSWELVIKDTALVVGPKVRPVCLGCLGDLQGDAHCPHCQWPLCSPDCQHHPHHQQECQIFRKSGFYPKTMNHGLYSCVSIIRVLLLKQNNKQGWTLIEKMMDHWEERSSDQHVISAIKVMTNLVIKHLGMSWITPSDVEHVYGVLKTNAVDINDGRGQALFPNSVCIMSHSCNANLEPVSDPSQNISFRAKRNIAEGEELTIRYTDFIESKYNIRSQIVQEWKFWCLCQRCTDQTECGTNISSLQCSCGGFLYDLNPEYGEVYEEKLWKCSSCQRLENLSSRYKDANQILKNLEGKTLEPQDMRNIQNNGEYHENFYLLVKLRIIFIEQNKNTKDR